MQVGAGKFQYRPMGSAWTFAGSSGLTANYSGFTQNNPVAPQGTQVAFLQKISSISQSIPMLPAGSYIVTVRAAQRNYPQPFGHQTFSVSIDGQAAATITPAGITYQTYYALLPPVAAGAHVITLSGLTAGGDNTAFVDAVSIVAALATPATVEDAWIGPSGKTVGFRFALSTQAPHPAGVGPALSTSHSALSTAPLPTQVIAAPTIYVNRVALGALGAPADLAGNEVLLFPLPAGVVIGVNDTVTATTPPIWQATTGGLASPLSGLTVDNRVGRSPLPPSALAPERFPQG